jgi:hypothetical protein
MSLRAKRSNRKALRLLRFARNDTEYQLAMIQNIVVFNRIGIAFNYQLPITNYQEKERAKHALIALLNRFYSNHHPTPNLPKSELQNPLHQHYYNHFPCQSTLAQQCLSEPKEYP